MSTDHKAIGLLYAQTSLCFLAVGFVLVMRWQLVKEAALLAVR